MTSTTVATASRFRLRAGLAALACAAGLLAGAPAAAAATADDVPTAEEDLRSARSRAAAAAAALDEAAARFETARAHQARLSNSLAGAGQRLAAADGSVAAAEEAFAAQVAQAYKHPTSHLSLSEVVLLAPDAPSALHGAAVLQRIAALGAETADQTATAAALVVDEVAQERVVAAGTATAARDLRRSGAALRADLTAARSAVVAAEGALDHARQRAREQAEASRRAQAVFGLAGGAPAAPPVGGRVCPVGAPNGFIDSWGFPRSGGRTHQGVDMFAPYGTPLYAVADGVVERVYTNALGGLAISFVDDAGHGYYYAHLSAASSRSGQRVTAGAVIGAVGTSGNARGTPPHLHWEFHPNGGSAVNPYPLAVQLCR